MQLHCTCSSRPHVPPPTFSQAMELCTVSGAGPLLQGWTSMSQQGSAGCRILWCTAMRNGKGRGPQLVPLVQKFLDCKGISLLHVLARAFQESAAGPTS